MFVCAAHLQELVSLQQELDQSAAQVLQKQAAVPSHRPDKTILFVLCASAGGGVVAAGAPPAGRQTSAITGCCSFAIVLTKPSVFV
jgi:ABC-type hemin transport system substrate-binding protein